MTGSRSRFGAFSVVRRWWVIVLAAIVLGTAAGAVLAPRLDSVAARATDAAPAADQPYEATVTLVPAGPDATRQDLEQAAVVAQQGEVPTEVADELGAAGDAGAVTDEVEVAVDDERDSLTITAQGPTASGAETVAATYAAVLVAHLDERAAAAVDDELDRLRARAEMLQAQISELQIDIAAGLAQTELDLARDELDDLQATSATTGTRIRQLEVAESSPAPSLRTLAAPTASPLAQDVAAPDRADAPSPVRRALWAGLGALVGLLVGLVIAWLLERRAPLVRTVDDTRAAFDLPVLASLPSATGHDPFHADVDAVACHASLAVALRRSVAYRLAAGSRDADRGVAADSRTGLPAGHHPPGVVLVTSPAEGTGTSTTVLNLALAYVDQGLDVLVVDCAFEAPVQDVATGTRRAPTGLRERAYLADVSSMVLPTVFDGLSVLPAGASGPPPSRLATDSATLVERAREQADVVLIDAGPLLGSESTNHLLDAVDSVLVVARADRTSAREARHAGRALHRVGAPVDGVALVEGSRPAGAGDRRAPGVSRDDRAAIGAGTMAAVTVEVADIVREPVGAVPSSRAELAWPSEERLIDLREDLVHVLDAAADLRGDAERDEVPSGARPARSSRAG